MSNVPTRLAIILTASMSFLSWCSPNVQASLPLSTQPEALFAPFPNTELVYYDVTGNDAVSIRQSMDSRALRDGADRVPVDAYTSWYISWQWPMLDGVCDLAHISVTFRAMVTLPRLVGAQNLAPALAAAWHRYLVALMTHEAGHVRMAYESLGRVTQAVHDSSCATANETGQAMLQMLRRQDVAYDRATRHGATQGAVFPPPSGL